MIVLYKKKNIEEIAKHSCTLYASYWAKFHHIPSNTDWFQTKVNTPRKYDRFWPKLDTQHNSIGDSRNFMHQVIYLGASREFMHQVTQLCASQKCMRQVISVGGRRMFMYQVFPLDASPKFMNQEISICANQNFMQNLIQKFHPKFNSDFSRTK